jgi:nitrogen fixation protein NifB
MKIAVATTDGTSMSQHFGQSTGFIVFEAEGAVVKSREFKGNQQTPHAQGLCDGEHGHNHGGIVELLQNCDLVLCGGMGAGAAQALSARGIKAVIVPSSCSADEAVSRYLAGSIGETSAPFCNCQH